MKSLFALTVLIAAAAGLIGFFQSSAATTDGGIVQEELLHEDSEETTDKVELTAPNLEEPERVQKPIEQGESAEGVEDESVTTERAAPTNLRGWLSRVKPGALENLTDEQMAALRVLDLRGADITDADLAWIAQLKNLTELSLYGNPITDAGLVQLSGLHALERINLRGTKVTGLGLAYLPTQSLEHLHLCNSEITKEDLRSTPPMPALKTLKLNFLGFEDDMVESLNVYPNLRHLEIDRSKITDAGLARLLEINPGLTRIELRNTNVSPEGLLLIQQSYPNCELITD